MKKEGKIKRQLLMEYLQGLKASTCCEKELIMIVKKK